MDLALYKSSIINMGNLLLALSFFFSTQGGDISRVHILYFHSAGASIHTSRRNITGQTCVLSYIHFPSILLLYGMVKGKLKSNIIKIDNL